VTDLQEIISGSLYQDIAWPCLGGEPECISS